MYKNDYSSSLNARLHDKLNHIHVFNLSEDYLWHWPKLCINPLEFSILIDWFNVLEFELKVSLLYCFSDEFELNVVRMPQKVILDYTHLYKNIIFSDRWKSGRNTKCHFLLTIILNSSRKTKNNPNPISNKDSFLLYNLRFEWQYTWQSTVWNSPKLSLSSTA